MDLRVWPLPSCRQLQYQVLPFEEDSAVTELSVLLPILNRHLQILQPQAMATAFIPARRNYLTFVLLQIREAGRTIAACSTEAEEVVENGLKAWWRLARPYLNPTSPRYGTASKLYPSNPSVIATPSTKPCKLHALLRVNTLKSWRAYHTRLGVQPDALHLRPWAPKMPADGQTSGDILLASLLAWTTFPGIVWRDGAAAVATVRRPTYMAGVNDISIRPHPKQ